MRLHEPDGYECRFAALMAVPSARRDRRRVRGVRGPDCTSREADRRDRDRHLGPFGLCDATRAGLIAGHIRPASILGADGPKGMQRLQRTGRYLRVCVASSMPPGASAVAYADMNGVISAIVPQSPTACRAARLTAAAAATASWRCSRASVQSAAETPERRSDWRITARTVSCASVLGRGCAGLIPPLLLASREMSGSPSAATLAIAHRPNSRPETSPLSSSSTCSCRLSLLIFVYSARTTGSGPSRVWTNSSSVISSAPGDAQLLVRRAGHADAAVAGWAAAEGLLQRARAASIA